MTPHGVMRVKTREMRGQPGKKVGCPNRPWMLEENSISLLREDRNCICRVMCMEEMMWISWSRSGWLCNPCNPSASRISIYNYLILQFVCILESQVVECSMKQSVGKCKQINF